jgi:HPt (histidine-containing phosphotransfer) domain-containing protein
VAASNVREATGSEPQTISGSKSVILDEIHLGRMTLGDRGLEREILEIFVHQAAIMIERVANAEPALAAAAAHTLMGSARGIGVWRVAKAAERLERVSAWPSDLAQRDEAIEDLKAATLEASAVIGARLNDELRRH